MNTSKKFTNNKINEGESPEENSILDDLQSLVNLWKSNSFPTTTNRRVLF